LIYLSCPPTSPNSIQGFVNDWPDDKKVAAFAISIPDASILEIKVCAAVHDQLVTQMENEVGNISLKVPSSFTHF